MAQEQIYRQSNNSPKHIDLSYDTYPSIQAYHSTPHISPLSVSSTPLFTPIDDTDLSYSNLSTAFHETDLNHQVIMEKKELSKDSPISLVEMLCHFPDLPSFISHAEFPNFLRLWFDFQTHITKKPGQRQIAQAWIRNSLNEIHRIMLSIASTRPDTAYDPEAVPCSMFLAFRQLKDHLEAMYQMFQIVEDDCVWLNQHSLETSSPLVDMTAKVKQNIDQFRLDSHELPIFGDSSLFIDDIHENLTEQALEAYFLLASSSTHSTESTTCLEPVQDGHSPLFHNLNSAVYIPHQLNLSDCDYSHVEPSWIQPQNTCFWASAPVTPSVEQSQCQQFISLPTTPTWTEDGSSFTAEHIISSCPPTDSCGLSPKVENVERSTGDEDEKEKEGEETSDAEEEDDDDEYIASFEEEEEEVYKDRTKRRQGRSSFYDKRFNGKGVSSRQLSSENNHTRRTATSYDPQTTHYLKSIFFNIYSNRDKLTKEQRKQIQKETGLKPRNITYWFSNHKRRFQTSLLAFKKTVKESNGKVKSYDDFLKWRKDHGLPEDVLENE